MVVTTGPAPASDLGDRVQLPAAGFSGPRPAPIVGRVAERRRLEGLLAPGDGTRSVVLVGEAGIGRSTLWTWAVDRCRTSGATVLVARPGEADARHPGQGLLDLLGPSDPGAGRDRARWWEDEPGVLSRSRQVLDHLGALAQQRTLVLAVDDLPWLDPARRAVLTFVLRRLDGPVTLLATARTWSPGTLATPVDEVDRSAAVVEVGPLSTTELRRVVRSCVRGVSVRDAARACDLAHGNAWVAVELSRAIAPGGAGDHAPVLDALGERICGLPPATTRLLRLLSLAGPSPVPVLAGALAGPVDEAVRAGLDAGVLTLDEDFVLRLSHPLIATYLVRTTNRIDRAYLHGVLAEVVPDPDVRVLHLARASAEPREDVAARLEAAATRFARRREPRPAAELLGHSVRLTPAGSLDAVVRRTLGQAVQLACAGDLPTATGLTGTLLDRLGAGPQRAEVVARRVTLDFVGAEEVLLSSLQEVPAGGPPDRDRLRGRLLGVLGWLVGVHLGRPAEGLALALEGLALGRARGDDVLVAQAASAASTASLLLGRSAGSLVDEAVALGDRVTAGELVLWPRVLRGRQRLWDGRLGPAGCDLEAMLATARGSGTQFQLAYRRCDLAQLALAAGDLDLAAGHCDEGLHAARDCGDERAVSWLAYPSGQVAALRGDAATAEWCADRLDWWAERVGERPRRAMAWHVRCLLAGSGQDWAAALELARRGQEVLDSMGYVHPGPVPLLPQAVQLATLAGDRAGVETMGGRLRTLGTGLGSSWVQAHARAATGLLLLLDDDPGSVDVLADAHGRLLDLGTDLDAARIGCSLVAAGLRSGRRRDVREVAERSGSFLADRSVRGWEAAATRLRDRLRGTTEDDLTATEREVAALVASGHRNREIGTRLFVSESTVEAHLTRIYRKLGLRNRAELSHRVTRLATGA